MPRRSLRFLSAPDLGACWREAARVGAEAVVSGEDPGGRPSHHDGPLIVQLASQTVGRGAQHPALPPAAQAARAAYVGAPETGGVAVGRVQENAIIPLVGYLGAWHAEGVAVAPHRQPLLIQAVEMAEVRAIRRKDRITLFHMPSTGPPTVS